MTTTRRIRTRMLDRDLANEVIGDAVIFGEAVASQVRQAMAATVQDSASRGLDVNQIIAELWLSSRKFTPAMAEAFWRSDVMAWVTSFNFQADQMPGWLQAQFLTGRGKLFEPVGSPFLNKADGGKIVYPKLQEGARALLDRQIVTREQFDAMSLTAASSAFTVAELNCDRAIAKVRDTIARHVQDGGSLQEFKADEVMQRSTMGPGHLENVYRTNIQGAFRDGQETVMSNPIVAGMFPYQAYHAIHDGRVRETHKALETLGLNGTNVYRRDDPFWDHFTPPWGYQCRCGTNALTIDAAAELGVKEAIAWRDSGSPPSEPEHRLEFIPFSPPPGFGARGGSLVIS